MIKSEELTNPASCMSRAREDEMTFVLLGRDTAAPGAIRYWVQERIRLGKNSSEDPQITEALACAERMEHPGTVDDAIHARTEIPIKVGCEKFLQVEMFARGCVSGRFNEWPLLRAEVRKLLDSYTSQALEIASLRAEKQNLQVLQLKRVEPENKP